MEEQCRKEKDLVPRVTVIPHWEQEELSTAGKPAPQSSGGETLTKVKRSYPHLMS